MGKAKPGKTARGTRAGKTTTRAKVKIAVVRALAECVADTKDPIEQLARLAATLDQLPPAQHGAAAEAVLAHTRKGTPVARAYLQALVDAAGGATQSTHADTVARQMATMTYGRGALRGAFAAIWRLVTDADALDGAFKNFVMSELDDPDLYAAGVEAARYRGDAASLAEREARLAIGQRLRPLVDELRASGPARKRAKAKLAALSPEELWHVHARVLCEPREFDEDLAVAAILALTDDPRAGRLALVSAIAESEYHGRDELVSAWKQRVAGGDTALVARLQELLDMMAERASEDDELEPYIHALYPAGNRPEVFAQIERLLASPNMVVRQTICEEWVREAEGQKAFTPEQADRIVRAMVAIAVNGDDEDDERAANRALFYMANPGARTALMDAIRTAPTKQNDELRWNLYYGLSNMDHPEVIAFAIERLFVEDEELWALLEIFEAKLSPDLHREALAALEAKRGAAEAARGANLYADVLIDKKSSPALLIELARAVAAWPDPADKKDGRRLRYILEYATAAALDAKRTDDARTFLARARALPAPAYSDYQEEDRESKTESALAKPEVKKQVAALESGALDKAAKKSREAAAAARAAGTPIAADDDRLAALAKRKVGWRLVTDARTHETWFLDEGGELHVYDGYEVGPPPCQKLGDELRKGFDGVALKELLAGRARIDERVTFMAVGKKKGGRTREALRFGDRVLVFDGHGPDYWEHITVTPVGLAFADAAAARRVFALVADNPPDDTVRIDPWYVDGKGAVTRKYYAPLPDGGYNGDGDASVAVLGHQIVGRVDDGVPPLPGRDHVDGRAAVAAFEAWEAALCAERGGLLMAMWIDEATAKRSDTVLAAFFEDRYRDDERDAAWHLRGLEEMWAEVVAAGLADQVPDIRLEMGPPATADEIATYQALVPEPLPETLVEVWRQVGRGGYTSKERTVRFLSPAELVARRQGLRDELRRYIETRRKPRDRASWLEMLDDLDVIAVIDDRPLMVFDTKQRRDDGRCFASADSDWWEKALNWQIATDINTLLKDELEARVGDVFRLRLGQRASADARRARLVKGDKFWEAIVEGAQLMTRHGPTGRAGRASIKQLASAAAAGKEFDKQVAAQRGKGYKPA